MEDLNRQANRQRGLEIYNFLLSHNIKIKCPNCGKAAFARGGYNQNGNIRLICKVCGNSFPSTVNTVFEGTSYSLQEAVAVIYDMVSPIVNPNEPPVYNWPRSRSKKWLMNHKILTAASEIMRNINSNECNSELWFSFSHKGVKDDKSCEVTHIRLNVTNNNCYLYNGEAEPSGKLNNSQQRALALLHRYLTKEKRSVSTKYLNLYVYWFSFVMTYINKCQISLFSIKDAERMLAELTKYSVNLRISNTLKTLVAR